MIVRVVGLFNPSMIPNQAWSLISVKPLPTFPARVPFFSDRAHPFAMSALVDTTTRASEQNLSNLEKASAHDEKIHNDKHSTVTEVDTLEADVRPEFDDPNLDKEAAITGILGASYNIIVFDECRRCHQRTTRRTPRCGLPSLTPTTRASLSRHWRHLGDHHSRPQPLLLPLPLRHRY
jgi:hypothetical protein